VPRPYGPELNLPSDSNDNDDIEDTETEATDTEGTENPFGLPPGFEKWLDIVNPGPVNYTEEEIKKMEEELGMERGAAVVLEEVFQNLHKRFGHLNIPLTEGDSDDSWTDADSDEEDQEVNEDDRDGLEQVMPLTPTDSSGYVTNSSGEETKSSGEETKATIGPFDSSARHTFKGFFNDLDVSNDGRYVDWTSTTDEEDSKHDGMMGWMKNEAPMAAGNET